MVELIIGTYGLLCWLVFKKFRLVPTNAYTVCTAIMIGGFAMIAYPADYGNSGVMSFIVNQQGVVYERDLGEETAVAAQSITEYDPTDWTESKD